MSDVKTCPTCGTEYPMSERFCPRDGTALRGSNPQGDLVGSIVHEKFHVMKKLGEGGMGAVYLAEHVKMGRKMALKVMNPGMHQDPDAIARFNREAKNASQINHPNVCAIYDFGETPEGMIYLAMEFIEGSSLSGLIEKTGSLAPARAASIVHQAADALQVAHDYGIVHRDLKPDNIMIAKNRDGSDQVKVVDFGIAKASSSDAQKVTKTGLVVGTPEYMSPEQLAGDKLDGRSDIYSLALVAFNCFTGTLPFPSNSAQEAMIMRLTDVPKRLDEMRPDVAWPEELQAVMDKALARDANERYQSAAQFGRDLSKSVENMPSTIAAEAGTQVIGSGAAIAAAAAKTAASPAAAVPKTRLAPKSPTPAAPVEPAAPAKKAGMPMALVAGIVVVVIGGGAFAAKQMGLIGGTKTAGDSTTSPTTQTPLDAGTSTQNATSTQGAGRGSVDQFKAPVTPPPDGGRKGAAPPSGNTGGTPAGGGADLNASYDTDRKAWADWTDIADATEATAGKVVADVSAKLAAYSGDNKAEALYYRGQAYLIMTRKSAACDDFRAGMALAKRDGLRDKINVYLTADGAPCK